MFAKLYETEETGQVLVKLAEGDEGPEVRYYFEPKGLGVCSFAFQFKDDEKGSAWDKADAAFERADEEQALRLAKGIMQKMTEAT
jgi:hypothetical protein